MKIAGCTLGIKTDQKVVYSLDEDPATVEVHRIELRMPNGANYLHAQEFGFGHLGLGDAGLLIHRIQEKGEVNMGFWREGDPVYGSERYLQREPEIVALEKQHAEDDERFGPGM